MGWFGPRGDCGCCGDDDGGGCECTSGGDCIPEGQTSHIGPVLTISNVPDEVTHVRSVEYPPNPTRTCRPGDTLWNVDTYRIYGLSQVNGSYPILYVRYDETEEEWVEAEPGDGCNFWAFPQIDFTINWELTTNDEFSSSGSNPPCNPSSSYSSDSATSTLNARSAMFSQIADLDNFIPSSNVSGGQRIDAAIQAEWFACASQEAKDNVTTVHTNNPFQVSLSANVGRGSFLSALGLPYQGPVDWWGPLGAGESLPAPMPGYNVYHERDCRLGAKFSNIEHAETSFSIASPFGFTTHFHYSSFRITRELTINP